MLYYRVRNLYLAEHCVSRVILSNLRQRLLTVPVCYEQLREWKINPHPFRNDRKFKVFVPQDLLTRKRVFCRVDRVEAPLENPHDGPYTVKETAKEILHAGDK